MSARILVVEDDRDLGVGLRQNLEYEGYEVAVAAGGAEGLERLSGQPWDLVILDLMLPDLEGFDVLRRMRAAGDDTLVLILSARGGELDKVRGLRLGADDYLTKPFKVLELVARVEALLRRRGRGSEGGAGEPESYAAKHVRAVPATRAVYADGEEVALTPKEFDLLVALMRRGGAVASRLDLLREVWGHQASVETRTVDTHVGGLRRKLERDPGEPEVILTVWKVGYKIAL